MKKTAFILLALFVLAFALAACSEGVINSSVPDNSSGNEVSSEVSSTVGGGYNSDWDNGSSEASSEEASSEAASSEAASSETESTPPSSEEASSDPASSDVQSSDATSSDTATSNATSSEASSKMPDVYCPECGFVPENQLDAPKYCHQCGAEYIDNGWSSGWV